MPEFFNVELLSK
uniref:Uncharacterized protein n=1 Tax=Moniliophthora roreri TaxID=221103 RepID=A0A0W0EYG2_MONRR